MIWADPAPHQSDRRSQLKADLELLVTQPGRWGVVAQYAKAKTASSLQWRLTNIRHPYGLNATFEAKVRTQPDGTLWVQARAVTVTVGENATTYDTDGRVVEIRTPTACFHLDGAVR